MRLKFVCSLFILTLALLILPACSGSAASVVNKGNLGAPNGTGFITKTIITPDHTRAYSLFVPHQYTPQKRWPVIVFLHGIGEAGSDAQANLTVGLGPQIAEQASNFNFIVLFAQSTGGWDANSQAGTDVIAELAQLKKDYSVDADRVYLTGMSTGGYGTWAIGAKYRDQFAALVPLCGYSAEDALIPELTQIPVWAFHNSGDPFVMANSSRSTCDRINKAGGHARYTEYGAFGHDCWHATYSNPELYSWLLAQRRTSTVRTSQNPAPTPATPQVKANSPTVVNSPY